MITPIHHITPIHGTLPNTEAVNDGSESAFESILRNAIDHVKTTEKEAVQNQYLMATGQLDNPAALAIAQTKSSIAVEMLVQLRNKSLEAYNELTRMNL